MTCDYFNLSCANNNGTNLYAYDNCDNPDIPAEGSNLTIKRMIIGFVIIDYIHTVV